MSQRFPQWLHWLSRGGRGHNNSSPAHQNRYHAVHFTQRENAALAKSKCLKLKIRCLKLSNT
jgi:hypothetical protein